MPNIRTTTGEMESAWEIYWELSSVISQISKGETTLTTTPDSNTPTTQPADSNTSPTMSEIMSGINNFSTNNTKDLQRLVVKWADQVYPSRTLQDTLIKLLEEVAELFKDPNEEELADVLILTLDLFHLAGVAPGPALITKMKINIEERTWKIDPKTGIMKHATP